MKKTVKILFMALTAWILAVLCAWVVSAWAVPAPAQAAPVTAGAAAQAEPSLVILFTHDLHSYLLPHHAVNGEGKIEAVGGYARIAAAVKKQRERWGDKTLLVDAGDFAEGTLFHTVLPDEALEFRLMGKMGYDAVTVGNHDFDFHPLGLAKMLGDNRDRNLFILSRAEK